MPTVRYQIKNEYGMADPEVYRAAEKDDPEALLEGVAMAGLVGVLRQLGDLAEFAAEVFHDLHEEVMITSARGHGLILRVQQLEAEFPFVEKTILSQTDHSHCAYNAGTDWHPNLRVEHNLVIQGDMPRFILDSYEECRGPPRLFMLDKFDVAGAGACLTRYSNPSFFKTESASFEVMEPESKREKRSRKIKPKGSCLKNGEMTNPFLTPIIGYSQVEPVPEKFPARRVKLKHRNLKISDVSNTKSYMESIINEVLEDLTGGVVDSSILRDELLPHSPEKFQNEKNEGKDFLETKYTLSGVLEKLHPASQTAKEEEMLMELGNELDIHDFDVSSDENYVNHPSLQLAERNDFLHDSGFITDVDRDSYRSDDIGSELENYVDALNTLETEAETDYDNRGKSDPNFINRQSQAINANNNGYIELQPKSSGSSFIGSFDSLVHSEKVMEAMPSLPQSSNLVDLPYEQLQLRIISASSSKFKINQGEPIGRHAISSSSIADSELEPNGNFREVQPLTAHSLEVASGSTASTPEVNEYVESSFLPWKTNHVVVPPTFEESPAVLEEANLQEYNENRISATLTDIDHMPCYTSKTEYFILPEKAPTECSIDSSLTLMDDEIGKPLQSPDAEERIDSISETLSTPMGSITPDSESHDMSIELVIDMQSEYLTMKSTSGYLEGLDDERKQLNSSVASAAEAHELSLLDSEDSGSHGFTQTFDNVVDDSADIPDERGSNHESLHSSRICHFSEHTEKTMPNNASNTSQIPEFPQKSCFGHVSTVYAKDSLQGSKDKDNFSVKKLLPENSNFSLGIVSSNLQSESLNDEINNVSVTHEEFVHPQFPATSTSPVSDEFEQFPVAEEPQKSANSGILELLLSVSEENSDANHMQHALELIDINGKDHVNGGLELADEFTELDLQQKIPAEESKEDNKSLDGYIITEDGIDGPVLNLLESAKVSTFDLLLIEDPLPDDDALHQLPSKKKSYFPLPQNEEQAMLVNPLSTQTSVSDLSRTLDAKFVDVNYDPTVKLYPNIEGDNISSRENKLFTDSISEDVITKDDIDDKDLSMLKSSNLCSYDLQFQEDPVSEDATFNRHISEIENMDISGLESVSKNVIAEEGNDAQNSSLLESPYAYSFDAHTQEDLVSEDTSNHSLEIEEFAITSGLTPLNVEKPASVVSLDPYSPNCANDTVSEHNLDDILFEFDPCRSQERLICFREDDQSSYSDTSMQPFQSGAESAEVPSEEASISEQSTVPLHRNVENLEPSNIILNEYFSDRYSIIQHSLDHEVLNEESKLKDFGNHSSHYEMNMPLSKEYVGEQIENDLSVTFQDISEQPGSSVASEVLALPGETNSRMPLKEGIDEIPPLPLPPVQWRIGKPPSEPLISDRFVPQPVNETNPFIAPSNLHVDQHENPFLLPSAFEKNFQHVFYCTDAQLTQSLNLSEPPQINLDQRKQLDTQFSENGCVHSSGLPLILSYNVDGNHAHGDISMEREDQFTSELRRPKLVKLLPGLELERSQEVSVIGTDAIPPFNPFMSMPAIGDGISQYDYGNYGSYEGENLQYQGSSASFPVAIQGFPRYGYHMFLNEGISSTMYDTALSEMEGDIPNGKHRSIRNRQRDPLIEAVAAHDKSTLRKVSELDRPMTKPKEDEPNYLLEQIKEKSFNLKPATSAKASMLTAPSTNLKVAAILQKANAIRQACVGSDEDVDDNDDNWS